MDLFILRIEACPDECRAERPCSTQDRLHTDVSLSRSAVPVALADPPYANCKEAHADGKYNIPRGAPGYSAKLDRDRDGLACEG
ncbi:excalibur calcium-binding domain-containing protein [Mycobacteroides abscessus]|uniref:excalibur calcium-binding domain-containing protein n=1 Tax=Mycobacteroides abscessus TaxID=36809 RepID=UPI0039A1A1F9